eukprot:3241759-Amphidinium_carterae.1
MHYPSTPQGQRKTAPESCQAQVLSSLCGFSRSGYGPLYGLEEEEKAAKEAARKKAREEERARCENEMERRRHAAARQRQSAELRHRLRAEKGMTMADILHVPDKKTKQRKAED